VFVAGVSVVEFGSNCANVRFYSAALLLLVMWLPQANRSALTTEDGCNGEKFVDTDDKLVLCCTEC